MAPLILIVDNEEHIITLISAVLQRVGYRVVSVVTPNEVLDVWEDEISLLLTDFVMPTMNGDALGLMLLKRKPTLRIIFMSGSPFTSLRSDILLQEKHNFLKKPFGIVELLSTVRAALSNEPEWRRADE